MRLTFIFVAVIAATLHTNGGSSPLTTDSNAMVENSGSTPIVDPVDGRLLRRIEKSENVVDEERGFDAILNTLKKINPIKKYLRRKKHTAGVKTSVKEAGEYHEWLVQLRKEVGK